MINSLRKIKRKTIIKYKNLQEKIFIKVHGLPSISIGEIAQKAFLPDKPIMDDICMPPYFESGYYINSDFFALIRIAHNWKPEVIFEYGTAHGNTVANLCKFTNAKVFTLNATSQDTSGSIRTFDLTEVQVGRVYKKYGYSDRVCQIYSDSIKFEPKDYFSNPTIDIAVIDACHDIDYVLNDFQKIQPFVREGGIVLFHDTHPSCWRHLKSSYFACCYLRRKGFDIKHIEHTWWAFWIKKQ